MGSLGLGCMMRKYVNYNETSTLAPRSEFQMFSGAMWQLKAQIIIMRMVEIIQSLADERTVLPKVFQLFFISHYYKNILALKNTID